MRPVQLVLDGFATFRTRAVIDFTDADYFALVGATGAGKSTVLDGITFALYGSVPRWNDKRMISPALAPTASRAVVRLIFDADGVRYAAAREARRGGGKNPQVTMHASRLERLHDPDDFDGDTDLLAADTEVTPTIARLLGLTYQHFTTCVALPQGRFAEFLHAKASERQDILSSLLGYQFYDELHQRAGVQARDHRTEANGLETTLAGYADATAEYAAERTAAAEQLAELQTALADVSLPALDVAADAVATAATVTRELEAQQSALASVTVPADVANLDAKNTDAIRAQATARAELAAAEEADSAAADAVTAFRPRFELQTLKRQWEELAAAAVDLPKFAEAAAAAATKLEQARVATEEAERGAESLRQVADAARIAAVDAATAAIDCEQQANTLGAVSTPHGIAELADTLADLARRRAAAELEADQADQSCDQARAALEAFVGADTLDAGLRAANTLTRNLREDLAAATKRAAAVAAAADSAASLTAARKAAQQAAADLEQAQRDDQAGALRAHLHSGGTCPVCEQTVATVPDSAADSDVAALTAALSAAQEAVAVAERDKTERDGEVREAGATRAAHLAHAETARNELNAVRATLDAVADSDRVTAFAPIDDPIVPGTPDAVLSQAADDADVAHSALSAAAQGRRTLAEALAAADTRRTAATAARRDLDQNTRAVDDAKRRAVTALNAARDTVRTLGAPPIDPSELGDAWASLTGWAKQERAAHVTRLGTLKANQSTAQEAAAQAQKRHTDAAEALTQLRADESRAAQAMARTAGARDDTATRHERLRSALADEPDAGTVASLLTELGTREASAAQARATRDAARQKEKSASASLDDVMGAVTQSREQLAVVRDPLTRYGAPSVSGGGLAAAWNTLAQWAANTAHALTRSIAQAQKADLAAASAYSATAAAISDAFAANGLPAPPIDAAPGMLRSAAAASVAGAAATARAEATHAVARLDERARLEDRHAAADERAQVASTLANLLRSDGFRAWLFESALSSLVHDASDILFEMSSGQFELRSTTKDLEVIDHNDADSFRPVRTLSGGETFQASLALALALSRQVATLAASGAAKLESIFLDEGFGTLDETSLDVVAGTLETLASSGERMVGVVTHVAALAAQIPVRFEVTRAGSSSTITRVNA